MGLLAMWMLVASMAAYFKAMNMSYANLEAAAAAKPEKKGFWGWLSF